MHRQIVAAAGAAAVSLAIASSAVAAPSIGLPVNDLRSVPGTVPYGSGHAIPLKGKRPAWFTQDLERRVDAADGVPLAAPPDAPPQRGRHPARLVDAGAGRLHDELRIRQPRQLLDRDRGPLRLGGTGGHAAHSARRRQPGAGRHRQHHVSHNNDIGDDFALVSIRPELQEWVFPTMAFVGGPCGSYTGSGPEVLAHTATAWAWAREALRASAWRSPGRRTPTAGTAPLPRGLGQRGARDRRSAGRRQPDPPRGRHELGAELHRGHAHREDAADRGPSAG